MTTETPASVRTRSLDELLGLDLPPRNYLIAPWLKQFESAMIWAPPGVGKTMFCLSLALTIAGGGRFLGWESPRSWKVMVFDGEMPIHDLQERLRMLSGTIEGLDMGAAGHNLRLCSRQDQDPDAPFPDFGDEESQNHALNFIRSHRVDLVILDNLSTLASIDDENSASAIRPLIKFLMRLKQANVGCVVVHHSNKTGRDYRGSTNLATTFEVILGLHKADSVLDPTTGTKFTTDWTKFRGKPDATIGPRKVSLETTGEETRWVVERAEGEVSRAVVEMLRSGEYGTQKAVLESFPEHLWPTPGHPPSKGWMSRQFALIQAQGIMTKHDIAACFEAAPGGDVLDRDYGEGDDF